MNQSLHPSSFILHPLLLIPLFGGLALIKLFPTRVELKPVAGRFEPVERSAFRTLGLAATATQGEVFDAASRVRLALKLGVRKTFDADAAWLGTIERGESEVRDSVGRLSEPAQRARERLFWFHGRAPMRRAPNVAELMRAVDALLSGESVESGNGSGAQETDATLHDAALLALAGLVRLDPALRDLDAWARTFDLWQRVFECEEFWSRLVAADLKGDYEQPVTFGEVAELRMSAPRIVSAHVASRARDAAMREDLRACLRAFRLLRGAALPRPLLQEYEREAVGPIEDALMSKLAEAFAWVGLMSPAENDRAGRTRRNYSNQVWRRFDKLRPRLAEFVELAGADSFAARRVFEQASSMLFRLAENFDAAGRREECLFVCLKARALAPPEAEKLADIEEKLRALGAGEELKARTLDDYAKALTRELADERAPSKLFKDDASGGKTLDSFTSPSAQGDSAGCVTSIFFWVMMVAACLGLQRCGVINTRPTRTPFESLPHMTFTPPPLNLNLNLNYNIAPLNLSPYLIEPTTRPRRVRRAKSRLTPPPIANEAASPRE